MNIVPLFRFVSYFWFVISRSHSPSLVAAFFIRILVVHSQHSFFILKRNERYDLFCTAFFA